MRTGHSAQMRLASREEPPFSGKNTSGSCSRQRARSCHGMKWCTSLPQNYIVVILDQDTAGTQVPATNFPGESRDLHVHHGMLTIGSEPCKVFWAIFFQ